jgi:hypothetical protein
MTPLPVPSGPGPTLPDEALRLPPPEAPSHPVAPAPPPEQSTPEVVSIADPGEAREPGVSRVVSMDDPPPPSTARPKALVAGPFVPGSVPSAARLGLPRTTDEVRDYVVQSATARGIDPTIALRVVMSEGGLSPATWIGDQGSSFGPMQLHYGGLAGGANAVAGVGELFTKMSGQDARDLSTWRTQIDFGLDYAVRYGWGAWHGAARVGIGNRDGLQNAHKLANATGPAVAAAATGPIYHSAIVRPRVSIPNQFDSALSSQDAYAACGPVAAVAVARWLGRNPSVPEVLEVAKRVGWTRDGGMNGIANEKKLLDAMGIAARLETTVNWRNVRADALSGNPVILSSPGHYWVIDDYNPRTGTYHVGQSGLAYNGGAEWMTGAQIEQLGGRVNGALYVNHPGSPKPSMAALQPAPPARPAPPPVTAPIQTAPADRWWEHLPTASQGAADDR